MLFINPLAVLLIAFCTAVGALLGSWLVGLIIGLAIVLVASFAPDPSPSYRTRRRRARRR